MRHLRGWESLNGGGMIEKPLYKRSSCPCFLIKLSFPFCASMYYLKVWVWEESKKILGIWDLERIWGTTTVATKMPPVNVL